MFVPASTNVSSSRGNLGRGHLAVQAAKSGVSLVLMASRKNTMSRTVAVRLTGASPHGELLAGAAAENLGEERFGGVGGRYCVAAGQGRLGQIGVAVGSGWERAGVE